MTKTHDGKQGRHGPSHPPAVGSPQPGRALGYRQRQSRRSRRLALVTVAAALGLAAYLAYGWTYGRRFVATNDAYVTGNLVPLKAQTSGTVAEVRAEATQYVRRGEVLVRLDGLQAQVALERAEAVRGVAALFIQAETLRHKLAARQAGLDRSRRDLARYRGVAGEGAVSAQQVEDAEWQIRELEAGLRQTRAELASAEALVQATSPADHPRVWQAAAALKQAYLDQARQAIVAPVPGYVAQRTIQPGEQVRPDTPLLSIVALDYLWIEANFLESELAEVRPGQPVAVTVDLYGGAVVYHGEVLGLGAGTGSVFSLLPPDNATGNYIHIAERVPVRIGLDAGELRGHPLRPGLSASVRIDTAGPGRSVLEPLTTTPDTYKIDVYDRQLEGADRLIARIVGENLRGVE